MHLKCNILSLCLFVNTYICCVLNGFKADTYETMPVGGLIVISMHIKLNSARVSPALSL